ncbi:MAG: PhoH family protein [Clostridia bacterium]|nr:PhoH family protein [Clostridia bacterium]
MKKEFVLSTEAVLSAIGITQRFDSDNDVTIPMVVLEEVYSYNGLPEKKLVASRFVDYIDGFNQSALISGGVKQENGSLLRVVDNNKISPTLNNFTTTERRLIQTCLDRKKKATKSEIILIHPNPAIRMKAEKCGITSQPWKDEIFPAPENQYSGRVEVSVSQTTLDSFYKDNVISVKDIYEYKKVDWKENMFVVLSSETGASAIGRYTRNSIVPLLYYNGSVCKADNVEQKMLLECLLAPPEIAPLVICKGAAGTGKTFCTLSAALEKVAKYGREDVYSQILVGTPAVTIEEDIGFLPGDIDDKMGPYLGGIRDNLRMIFKTKAPEKDNSQLDTDVNFIFEKRFIQIQSIGHLRGRSIPYTMFIIDEAQNIKPEILLDIVTRAAKGTKIVLLGDPTQVNRPGLNTRRNGLVYISEKMKGNSCCWQVELNKNKSIRSELAQQALKILV